MSTNTIEPQSLPWPIADQLNRLIKARKFPAFAALLMVSAKSGRRENHFMPVKNLLLGDLEQLTEYHKRRAYSSLKRYDRTGSHRTAKTAAEHMFCAEGYRLRYRKLLGDERPEDFVIADPVFPEFPRERMVSNDD